jgi:Cd2+/Zn2+-exporting ATPase
VLAGMINGNGLLTIKVTKKFSESSVVKMAKLVEAAAGKKAQTERFITTFARYYTPVVVVCAFALAVLPPIFIPDARFDDWLYRALVVLVVSCPCALVVSIPLGYFGGIGGASRSGILIKGSNYLDALTRVRTVVFDKTGTLTKGDFKVTQIVPGKDFSEQELLRYCAYAEAHSNHPIAQSVIDTYGKPIEYGYVAAVTEISGHGLRTIVDGAEIIVGNDKMLHRENIEHDVCEVNGTVLHVVVNKKYAGYIVISDSLKEDALQAVQALHALNIRTVMLTGDNKSSADFFAKKLGIEEYAYELLPEDKVAKLEHYMNSSGNGKVAFIGDGINDAAVIARADIGIAMGALGSAAAIETADIVLMADSPMQVLKAIAVAKKTRVIVWQNIGFALGIKLLFILLGTFGLASMWEAVFADMGVALLAILNAVRVYN